MVMSKVLGVPLDAIQFATEIDSAVKAVEGKIASTKRSFDFIVMDYEMPAANGDAVTLKVRDIEDKYGVNPSFIFSWSTVRDWPGGEMGKPYEKANAILEKPIKQDNLRHVLIENGFENLLPQQPSTIPTPKAG
ncbi:hypothetical protein [Aquicella siphonis]|nr:hypothetical protein [Aquicella siphonis]